MPVYIFQQVHRGTVPLCTVNKQEDYTMTCNPPCLLFYLLVELQNLTGL